MGNTHDMGAKHDRETNGNTPMPGSLHAAFERPVGDPGQGRLPFGVRGRRRTSRVAVSRAAAASDPGDWRALVPEVARRARRLPRTVSGFAMVDEWRGTLSVGSRTARVLVTDALRLEAVLDLGPQPLPHPGGQRGHDEPPVESPLESTDESTVEATVESRLVAHRALPGNVRVARTASGDQVRGEVRLDGSGGADDAFALRELRQGLALAAGERSGRMVGASLDRERVSAAVAGMRWGEQAVVAFEDHWELRPRWREHVFPVAVWPEDDGLRLMHAVLRSPGGAITWRALEDAALRLNDTLRGVRLAWSGSALVVETRLHPRTVDASRLADAARAVVSAAARARPTLRLLVEQRDLAELYVEVLQPPHPEPPVVTPPAAPDAPVPSD